MKECILLHFHVKGVQTLWGSLLAAGCTAGYRSILFRIVTRRRLSTGRGKRAFLCLWELLRGAPGPVGSPRARVAFGRKAQKWGLAGAQGARREEGPWGSVRAPAARPRGGRRRGRWGPAPSGERPQLRPSARARGHRAPGRGRLRAPGKGGVPRGNRESLSPVLKPRPCFCCAGMSKRRRRPRGLRRGLGQRRRLAPGAAVDGARGGRGERGAVPGLGPAPVAGSRGAGGPGGPGSPQLGVKPLCILHLHLRLRASVVPRGVARAVAEGGDMAPVPARDPCAKFAGPVRQGVGRGQRRQRTGLRGHAPATAPAAPDPHLVPAGYHKDASHSRLLFSLLWHLRNV